MTFVPYWILDWDNDPNYEDNHNFGWTCVVAADTQEDALRQLRAGARSASLMPEDITIDCVRRATQEDINEYEAMGGGIS